MPYTYTGLKRWNGNTCNGVLLDNPEDFWNEHQMYFECIYEGTWWAFKPDLCGYQDKRCAVTIHTEGENIDFYYDRNSEQWIEWNIEETVEHFCCVCSKVPSALQPLLDAAIRKAYGYDAEVEESL